MTRALSGRAANRPIANATAKYETPWLDKRGRLSSVPDPSEEQFMAHTNPTQSFLRPAAARLSKLWVAVAAASLATPALAQDSVTLNRFRAGETTEDAFAISRPITVGHLRFGAQLHVDYAANSLVYERVVDSAPGVPRFGAVSDQVTANLGFQLGLFDRAVVYAGLPVNLLVEGDETSPLVVAGAIPGPRGAGLGDFYLGGRFQLLGDRADIFALAAGLTLYLPTGGGAYRGDNGLSVHPEIFAEVRPGGFRINANVGAYFRDEQTFAGNVEIGHELTYALGASLPVIGSFERPQNDRLDLHVQVFGATSFSDFFGKSETTLEVLGGPKFHHESGLVAGVAAGRRLTRGFGDPDFRVLGTVGFSCFDRPDAVVEAPVAAPPADDDGDGVVNSEDECPNQAEDMDELGDADGCPESDFDEDGIDDEGDACPSEPEDRDGFADEDGCADEDNDSDGVLDAQDACPLEAGNQADGCPEPDSDGDGVADRVDNCPQEAGTAENFGCAEAQQVRITGDRLEILDKVYFGTASDRIRPRSYGLLDNVARVLNAHAEIANVQVEGHTDNTGNHDANVNLSERRAQAVVQYLTRKEVDVSRLSAVGRGPDQPLGDNETEEGRAQNRRVEFRILHPESTSDTASAPAE